MRKIERKSSVYIIIKGKVQGVSFRYFTLKQAQNLNTEDWYGIVQRGMWRLFAQGDKTNLELFIEILQQGPSFSRVDDMKLIWEHAERDYSDFPLSNKCN